MKIFFVLFGLCGLIPSSFAVDLREVTGHDGTSYWIDPLTHQVYCLPSNTEGLVAAELSHTLQVEQSTSAPSSLLPPSIPLAAFALPSRAPLQNTTGQLPQLDSQAQTGAMLASTTIGTGQSGGYAPTVELSAAGAAFLTTCVNNLFGPGVPVRDYSALEGAADQHAANVERLDEEVDRLKQQGLTPIQGTSSRLSEERVRRSQERRIIDVPSIPDPEDIEIPYQFQSQGEVQEDLKRLYKHLHKIQPDKGKRDQAKKFGLISVEEADQAFHEGDAEQGKFYKELAEGFLDIAIGLDPVTGFGRSTYELLIGRNAITGLKLNSLERSLAFVGVVTLGGSRTATQAGRGMWKIFSRASHLLRDRQAVEVAIREGEVLAGRAGRLLNGWKKNHKITNIHTAEHVNSTFPPHWSPRPFQHGSHVVEFHTVRESRWVRVHQAYNRPGPWVMRQRAIEGLSPQQIKDKFALPNLPTHVSDVHLPPKTTMWRGNIQNMEGLPDGAVQYHIKNNFDLPSGWFRNTRPL